MQLRNKAIAALCAIVLVPAAVSAYYTYGTARQETVLVTDKERITESDGTSRYLVYTTSGVFENTDSFWYLKFDSSDVYSELARDHTYSIRVYGWRVPFMSVYPNIVEAQQSD